MNSFEVMENEKPLVTDKSCRMEPCENLGDGASGQFPQKLGECRTRTEGHENGGVKN